MLDRPIILKEGKSNIEMILSIIMIVIAFINLSIAQLENMDLKIRIHFETCRDYSGLDRK